jgi:hypothetical protein
METILSKSKIYLSYALRRAGFNLGSAVECPGVSRPLSKSSVS